MACDEARQNSREDLACPVPETLRAMVGDTLVIGSGDDAAARTGEIIAVVGPHGSPPYRVRWLVGEYESMIIPGHGAHVREGH